MQHRAVLLFLVVVFVAVCTGAPCQQKDGSIDDETLRALFRKLNEAQAENMRAQRDHRDIAEEADGPGGGEDDGDDESPNYVDLLADLVNTTSNGMPPSDRVMKHRDVMRKVWLMFGAFKCAVNIGLIISVPLITSAIARRVGLTGWRNTILRGITTSIAIYYRGPFILQYAIIILGRLL